MTGPQIRALRTRLGLSQQEFGEMLTVPRAHAQTSVSRWERGKRRPCLATCKLMDIAGVVLDPDIQDRHALGYVREVFGQRQPTD